MKLSLESIEGHQDKNIICSITDRRGTILYVNPKFCEISGFTNEELIGSNHNIINSRMHEKSFFVEMWKTIGAGKIWQGEVRNRNKNGEYYWVDTIIFPIADPNNTEAHYLSVRTLINEKKHAEARKEERIEELQSLIHTISHQMRQPVTQIIGITSLLNELEKPTDEVSDLLSHLTKSVEMLNQYTKQLTAQVERIAKRDKVK